MVKLFFSLLLICSFLFSKEQILSQDKLKLFDLEEEKLKEESSKLKKDWVNPINLSYQKSQDKNYETTSSIISINQPIFKSGGIFRAIKYANNLYKYSNLSLEAQKKTLIKDATTILFNIKILDYQIAKQQKLLQNAKISLDVKKEGREAGILDETLIYDATIDVEAIEELIIDLEYQRDNLISKFKTLSDKKPQELELPKLTLLSLEEYKKSNINLALYKEDINVKKDFRYMTLARYLPTVNLFYNYTKYHENTNPLIRDDNSFNYGFSITIPLDIKSLNIIESSKIDYLKAKVTYQDKIKEERLFFENIINKIDTLEKRKEKAKTSIKNYNKKLEALNEDYQKGFIPKYSVDLYQNKKESKEYDIKIYDLQKQIELLELYAKVVDREF